MSVQDKTAIVTGAGSQRGIGRATAHALARAGWNIAILDLDEASAKDAAGEVAERNSVQVFGVPCDVTDESSVENALAALGRAPAIGALINNAGITSPTPFVEVTGEEWDRSSPSTSAARTTSPVEWCRDGGARIRPCVPTTVSAERGGGVFGGVLRRQGGTTRLCTRACP